VDQALELVKDLANRLAELASSQEGTKMAHLMRLMGFLGGPAAAETTQSSPDDLGRQPAAGAPSSVSPHRIGIWEPKQEDGKTYFVRSKEMVKDWNYWSNIGRIEPKGNRLRVVFMGESVARGYLYDPQYTPAMALEGILKSELQGEEVEVLDLARTNLGMDVKDLAIAVLQLEPDVAIIFSGNNWRGYPPTLKDIPYLHSLLRKEGMSGPKRFADDRLTAEVNKLMAQVAAAYQQAKVPLIWIVPEFNLGDWRDPILNAPHLPRGLNREWLRNREAAEQALAAGDLEKASELARGMIKLDRGTAVAAYYILAECCLRAGDLVCARQHLEAARDSVIWDSSKSASPRIYSMTQQALREGARKNGNYVVDLPQLFTEHLNGEIPDRRMFVDYCHLTSEGIQIAMAAAASRVLAALKGKDAPWQNLKSKAPSPSPSVESEASFLAAIHNAHWWQSYDLVYHYCSQAVRFSPEIADVMAHFIDFQTRLTPMLMCKSAEQVSAIGSPLTQHYLLRYNNQQLDPLLLSAVVNSLKQVDIDAAPRLQQLRLEEHSVTVRSANLLDYYYCSAGYQPQEVIWAVPKRDKLINREYHYFIAFWSESHFAFVGEADCPVNLELTCRLPATAPHESEISLHLNRKCIARLDVSRNWSTWDLTIPGDTIANGVNWVTIQWPSPEYPGLAAYDSVLLDLVQEKSPDFYCSFGEVFAFRASDARGVSASTSLAQEVSLLSAG